MSKLVDIFAEWAIQKKRWPLLFLLGVPVAFTIIKEYYSLTFRQTVYHWSFGAASGTLIILSVALYLYISYAEHIWYSWFVYRLRGGPRVVVSKAVAWQALTYTTPGGKKNTTIVGELASILSGLSYRIAVIKQEDLANFKPTKQDGFLVEGVAAKIGVVLKATMTINVPRAQKLIEQLNKDVKITTRGDNGEQPGLVVPAKRFVRNQFLHSRFTIETPLSGEMSQEVRTAVARLVLRYALAMTLYYEGDSGAAQVFRDIASIGKLLPTIEITFLARIYKTTKRHSVNVSAGNADALGKSPHPTRLRSDPLLPIPPPPHELSGVRCFQQFSLTPSNWQE